jgi:hypothetical protein
MSTNEPNLDMLDYSESNALTVWRQAKDILREHGRLCADEIADKIDAGACGYEEPSIRHGVLPAMREPLRDQGFISVNEVAGADEKIVKKEWVIDQ